jgi:hypothetical protein
MLVTSGAEASIVVAWGAARTPVALRARREMKPARMMATYQKKRRGRELTRIFFVILVMWLEGPVSERSVYDVEGGVALYYSCIPLKRTLSPFLSFHAAVPGFERTVVLATADISEPSCISDSGILLL